MPTPIADYAFIGDRRTGALISPEGSIDWLCLPDFDSTACFASVLGTPDHGRWVLSPVEEATTTRRYVGGSLVLETVHETASGAVRICDVMPEETGRADVLRRIEGVRRRVTLRHDWQIRPGYGLHCPLVVQEGQTLVAVAGPDRFTLRGPHLPPVRRGRVEEARFEVGEGEVIDLHMTWQ
ncbi:trehalase-like domain-containing protein [Mobilicoccus sp.]|uniref:trehalase-like domain-containing protein n=1 Tax=Mobilicoccus sp. TaxID=2034349 RepID=UPI0028B10B18|nr:trehalase-like domain-containing protein [Mobilicoccus sp.]